MGSQCRRLISFFFIQVAALNISQYLSSEVMSKMNWESEAATPASECSLPSLISSSNKFHNSKKKARTPSPPLTPLVEQITEMGFSKRGVEFAIRALSK